MLDQRHTYSSETLSHLPLTTRWAMLQDRQLEWKVVTRAQEPALVEAIRKFIRLSEVGSALKQHIKYLSIGFPTRISGEGGVVAKARAVWNIPQVAGSTMPVVVNEAGHEDLIRKVVVVPKMSFEDVFGQFDLASRNQEHVLTFESTIACLKAAGLWMDLESGMKRLKITWWQTEDEFMSPLDRLGELTKEWNEESLRGIVQKTKYRYYREWIFKPGVMGHTLGRLDPSGMLLTPVRACVSDGPLSLSIGLGEPARNMIERTPTLGHDLLHSLSGDFGSMRLTAYELTEGFRNKR